MRSRAVVAFAILATSAVVIVIAIREESNSSPDEHPPVTLADEIHGGSVRVVLPEGVNLSQNSSFDWIGDCRSSLRTVVVRGRADPGAEDSDNLLFSLNLARDMPAFPPAIVDNVLFTFGGVGATLSDPNVDDVSEDGFRGRISGDYYEGDSATSLGRAVVEWSCDT